MPPNMEAAVVRGSGPNGDRFVAEQCGEERHRIIAYRIKTARISHLTSQKTGVLAHCETPVNIYKTMGH